MWPELHEPSFAELSADAREHVGVDFDSDPDTLAKAAVIGLTIRAWRNTSLEDLHAGCHPSGGFPDTQMMRFNIATSRLVAQFVSAAGIDWRALESALTDPDRVLPGDIIVGELAGDEFEQLAADIRDALGEIEQSAQRKGFPYALTVLALRAGLQYKDWYGSPWWPDVVEVFIELLADPDSSAWARDPDREPEPDSVADRAALTRTLLDEPEALDDDGIYWCLGHGLRSRAAFAGYARWRRRREPDWIDPTPT